MNLANKKHQEKDAWLSALQWHLSCGIEDILALTPLDKTRPLAEPMDNEVVGEPSAQARIQPISSDSCVFSSPVAVAQQVAAECLSLEDLKKALEEFDGLSIRKTAMSLVFGAGAPSARLMVIGDAPGADEDRQGRPFVGQGGALLQKALAAIGFHLEGDNERQAAYFTTLLNWRPPGGRTPSKIEIDISLVFLRRHIALVSPDVLLVCGGLAAQALLGERASLSKLRGKKSEYHYDLIGNNGESKKIPVVVSYHPDALISTPLHKRHFWNDLQRIF